MSLSQGFVVFLAMAKLKSGIGVMILSFIIFVSLAMLSFGNIGGVLSQATKNKTYTPKNICSSASKIIPTESI